MYGGGVGDEAGELGRGEEESRRERRFTMLEQLGMKRAGIIEQNIFNRLSGIRSKHEQNRFEKERREGRTLRTRELLKECL